ncbi:MAG: hypothetical protein IJB62_09075 [Alistipes sp.]|nr:hypothetical protein [Alistipes sp.]
MGLFDIFKKKHWRCRRCKSSDGESQIMEVVAEWDAPHDYSEDRPDDIKFKIVRCPQCGNYAVVGPHPIKCCICKDKQRGVLKYGSMDYTGVLFRRGGCSGYGTYCTQCNLVSEGTRIWKDEKGHYIQRYTYNGSGHEVEAGKQRITILTAPALYYMYQVEYK